MNLNTQGLLSILPKAVQGLLSVFAINALAASAVWLQNRITKKTNKK